MAVLISIAVIAAEIGAATEAAADDGAAEVAAAVADVREDRAAEIYRLRNTLHPKAASATTAVTMTIVAIGAGMTSAVRAVISITTDRKADATIRLALHRALRGPRKTTFSCRASPSQNSAIVRQLLHQQLQSKKESTNRNRTFPNTLSRAAQFCCLVPPPHRAVRVVLFPAGS